MKRWMPFALATAMVVLIACADGLPTAAPDDSAVAALATVAVEEAVAVPIDVKPEAVNAGAITIKTNNRLAVALLVNEAIDVTMVDPESVELSVGEVVGLTPQHNLTQPAAFASHLKDVDGDLVIDYLVFHFDPSELDSGDAEACLTGSTIDAVPFKGCEAVTVK